MVDTRSKWEDELGRWLKPFLDRLGHKARRRMCPLYVSGLIGPGDRKSVQPMAARLAPNDYDQLHHFIADGVWDAAPLESELLVQADRLVGGKDAVLVIDDTAMPKKGDRSVGVAPQPVLRPAVCARGGGVQLKGRRRTCAPECRRQLLASAGRRTKLASATAGGLLRSGLRIHRRNGRHPPLRLRNCQEPAIQGALQDDQTVARERAGMRRRLSNAFKPVPGLPFDKGDNLRKERAFSFVFLLQHQDYTF
ncbi:hypothetical protein V1281_004689 [Nitrobacteraceae bacterium AZCC 2161]